MILNYGIDKNYVSHWGFQEALREIYQNFIDFGEYNETVISLNTNNYKIIISNDFDTNDNLEFLKIGLSKKTNTNSIGKYGEGLKLALLIFLREEYPIKIITNNKIIKPCFKSVKNIGEIFSINVTNHNLKSNIKFQIEFIIDAKVFDEFKSNFIVKNDIIFTQPYHGSIVNKPKGNLYCGNLFVCNIKNLSKSYNLNPDVLSLDRDRKTPTTFDVNYHTSKINSAYGKFTSKDLEYSDCQYIETIPTNFRKEIKVRRIDNEIVYLNRETKKVISNDNVIQAIEKDSFFKKIINKIKSLFETKTSKELLIDFQNKYSNQLSNEAITELDIIINKL